MPHPTITHLSVPKIGVLQGTSAVAAWLHARAGDYGPLERVNARGWPKVSIAELERRTGRPYSAEAIAAAAAAPAQLRAKKQKAAKVAVAAKREPVDLVKIIDHCAAVRDAAWIEWLSSDAARAEFPCGPVKAATVPLPVLYSDAQADHIAGQLMETFVKQQPRRKPPNIDLRFTETDVRRAVTRATAELEREWLSWRDRVLYPRKKYEPMRPMAKGFLSPSDIEQLTKG